MLVKKLITNIAGKKKPDLFAGLEPGKVYGPITRRPVFVTGVGRSGTHFMATLYEQSKHIQAMHLDDIGDSVGDAYNWFCKWYQPGADMQGFRDSRLFLAHNAGMQNKRYMESNPMIAFMIEDLLKDMDGQVIIMVRHPKQVVESHFQKGWYRQVAVNGSLTAPDYPYFHQRPNHFFSRIMPKDATEMEVWKGYGTLGKIAWMWMAVNRDIFRQVREHGIENKVRFVYLNDFDYPAYCDVNTWLGVDNELTEKEFNAITERRPGKGKSNEKPAWADKDKAEFNSEIGKVTNEFRFIADSNKWLF